jgi:endonuclease-3
LNKKEKTLRLALIIARLKELYPAAECALEYDGDAWKLLVMGRLSAQCTDKRVNIVSKELFKKYPTPLDMANADIDELSEIVKPCGLYRVKAQNIKDSSALLVSKFKGELPQTMDELLTFPGVGRKIANLLIGDVFGGEAIVCDTHCIRICGRLGMYPESEKNPEKIEKILSSLMDRKEGSDFCHRIVIFGREVCSARSPMCDECPLSDLCEHNLKGERRKEKA